MLLVRRHLFIQLLVGEAFLLFLLAGGVALGNWQWFGRYTEWIWLALAPLGVAALLWMHSVNGKLKRLDNRLCVRCGYDLRATSGRCPECGTNIFGATANAGESTI